MANPKKRFYNKSNRYPDWEKSGILDIFLIIKDRVQTDKTILSIKQGYGTIPRIESGIRIQAKESSIASYKPVRKGDFIIHLRSFEGGFEIANTDGIVSPAYTMLRAKNKIVPYFYKLLLGSNRFVNRDLRVIVEGIRDGKTVNISNLNDVKVYVPCFEEQQKIAAFFSTLDEKISLSERKLEVLEHLKKGLMQKIFNKELRFKDRNGREFPAWKYEKIGDRCKCFAGGTPSTRNVQYWDNGTIPWLSSGEISTEIVTSTEKRITEEGYRNSSTKMIKPNSVLIALAGQGSTRGKVALTKIALCSNQSIAAVEPDESLSPEFLYYYLSTQYSNLRLISDGGGGRGGLNLKLINDFEVPVPCIEEQEKIASFLSSVDSKILGVKKTTNKLNVLKQGFMQQMFV